MYSGQYVYLLYTRVQMEVDDVLGTRDEVTEEDLEKLQYTEQVVL